MAKEDRIGALWRKDNPNGPVAKGSIELNGQRINIVVWRNKWKAEDLQSQDSAIREQAHKKPDLYIEIDRPRDEAPRPQEPARSYGGPPPKSGNDYTPRPSQTQKADEFSDDIPF